MVGAAGFLARCSVWPGACHQPDAGLRTGLASLLWKLMPPMEGGHHIWEHGHRMVATTVGLLTCVFDLVVPFGTQTVAAMARVIGWAR